MAYSGGINLDDVEFSHNQEGITLMSDVSTAIGSLMMKDNTVDITTESPLKIKKG